MTVWSVELLHACGNKMKTRETVNVYMQVHFQRKSHCFTLHFFFFFSRYRFISIWYWPSGDAYKNQAFSYLLLFFCYSFAIFAIFAIYIWSRWNNLFYYHPSESDFDSPCFVAFDLFARSGFCFTRNFELSTHRSDQYRYLSGRTD